MNCPVCQVELKIADRQGVEIDYCPKCRGVWLDRGELDKIIERSTSARSWEPEEAQGYRDREYEGYEGPGFDNRKKRKSFLDDLFDFD